MVLTREELTEAERSNDVRVKYNLQQRSSTNNYIEQVCLDRKILQLLKKDNSIVSQFNNFVVRNADKFTGIIATNIPGWDSYGPVDEQVKKRIKFKLFFSICAPNLSRELFWIRQEKRKVLQNLEKVIKEELHLSD